MRELFGHGGMYEGAIWTRMYNVNVGGKDVTIALRHFCSLFS